MTNKPTPGIQLKVLNPHMLSEHVAKQSTDSKVTDKIDLYRGQERIDRLYKQMEGNLSKFNIEIINKYDREMVSQGIKKSTRHLHLSRLFNMSSKLSKNWDKVSSDDIKNLIYEIMDRYSNNGEDTEYTYDHKKVLKIFFRWYKLGNRDYKICLKKFKKGDPSETEDIIMKKPTCKLTGIDLISETEREWLLQACTNSRDRALIDVPLDGGIRPGELLSRRIKDVSQDKHGFILYVDGKTGTRTVRLLRCTASLAKWLSEHPFKENPDSPLWINFEKSSYGKPLSHSASRAILKRVCEKVKVKHPEFQKRVFLNLFRHTEATNSAKFMSDLITKKRHGWSPSSRMPARYGHILNSDVDDVLLKQYGILSGEEKPKLPRKCEICDMINFEDATICSKCGKPLDMKTFAVLEERIQKEKDDEKNKIIEEVERRFRIMEKTRSEEDKVRQEDLERRLRMLEKTNVKKD